jgi:hypothetical protein
MRLGNLELYAEEKPNKRFIKYIRNWLAERGFEAQALLVSKSNLVLVILPRLPGTPHAGMICFYIQKLCALGTGGVIIYYDLNAMSTRLKNSVENTFTNWLAQKAIT